MRIEKNFSIPLQVTTSSPIPLQVTTSSTAFPINSTVCLNTYNDRKLTPSQGSHLGVTLIIRLCLTLSRNLSPYNFQRLFLHISTNSVLLPHDNLSISETTIYFLSSQMSHHEFFLL